MRGMGQSLRWSSKKNVVILITILLATGCIAVPRQSVELSVTVGKDIAATHSAHRELAVILFQRMRRDINRFVDEVYAPYQISKLLQADRLDFEKHDPDSLFSTLDAALKNPSDSSVQKDAVDAMDIFVSTVRTEVESYREERLKPVVNQEIEVLQAIDRSYQQMHHGNSIVTGYLASVVKVHDAQEEILDKIGLKGLDEKLGTRLADASNRVAEIVKKAENTEGSIDQIGTKIRNFTDDLDTAVTSVREQPKAPTEGR